MLVLQDDVKFVLKGQQYLTILPQNIAGEGYWKHIALITASVSLLDGHWFSLTEAPLKCVSRQHCQLLDLIHT